VASRDLRSFKAKHHQQGGASSSDQLRAQKSISPENMPFRSRATLNQAQLNKLLTWLPMPPDPSHPYWDNKCLNCFAYKHRMEKGQVVCTLYLTQGHTSKLYPFREPATHLAPALQPKGNMGDTALPTDRPQSIAVFLHDNTSLTRVIDSLRSIHHRCTLRLWPLPTTTEPHPIPRPTKASSI
jgi:hypothetical protein